MLKLYFASGVFFISYVFGQIHEYYQGLIAQYHQDTSLALDNMNIDMINGGSLKESFFLKI
ncbi:MAG TPA: hypothetical protein PKB05_08795 [Oligoflexia bacterium]|nr:hypothetical protein [Oligoflexia bacterium]